MAALQLDSTAKNAERAFILIRERLAPLFALFEQEGVTEVNMNNSENVFVTRYGKRERVLIEPITEVKASQAVIELASSMGQEANGSDATGIVDAKMPGYRFSASLSPISTTGTSFTIRKHNPVVLSLDVYVEKGVIPRDVADYLVAAVVRGDNILIGGSTDSGKTTFLNALSREIPRTARVGTIEDTRELNLVVEDWLPLETNTQRGITATLCLKALMRRSPDRIILGECRDGAAAIFISATNTGHEGCMTTVHCNNAGLALTRLEDLCLQGDSDWPLIAIKRNIARSIQIVAHFVKTKDGNRRLNELVEVGEFQPGADAYAMKTIFKL